MQFAFFRLWVTRWTSSAAEGMLLWQSLGKVHASPQGLEVHSTGVRVNRRTSSMHPTNSTRTSGIPSHPTPVREAWQAELDAAIRRHDEGGMWVLIARQVDQIAAQEAMATLVSRLAYRISGRTRFGEMFLQPVIAPAACEVIETDTAWKAVSFAVGDALDRWLPSKATKTVFHGIRPFDYVSAWSPAVLRSHLYRTVPGNDQGSVTTLIEKVTLPTEAPRLGFMCMVLTSEIGWPMLSSNALADLRLREVVAFALQEAVGLPPPIVLAPGRVQFAIVDGVCRWLSELDRACKLHGWSATPIATSVDVVKVTLYLDSEQVPMTQFALRRHQIGLRGVNEVLQRLMSLAPFMDVERDASTPSRFLVAHA
ncbi:MAG: hypothetical protein KF871_12735 [Hydrogenophaga sp.]|uniref:hypothetical protein n=1 Tax=Hydrogenophaga sp. TaxID=1904254 RepID=UPI001D88EEF0|nr:hypothetical protein [Hydrogenophaga sp.]MBX3610753.1 hypothetical protein [Hydrogenophaga sp.]